MPCPSDGNCMRTLKSVFIFRFGTHNEALGCTSLAHRNDFRIDKEGMKYAIESLAQYVLTGCGPAK